jgi:very-short-patch-repair endonuclease
VVQQCGGAARWDRLRHHTTHRALQKACAAGTVRRPAPGLHALPGAPADVLAAAAVRGVRSCHSAAAALGLPLVDPPARPHVTAGRGTKLVWRGALVHRRDVTDLNGCTDVLTTVLDCLRCLPRRTALVPLDAALAAGRVSWEDLNLAAKGMNRNDDRRKLLAMADEKSGSPLESIGRYDLLEAGYSLQTQVVLDPAGRVDFLIDGWLVVELDGRRTHDDPVQFAEDRRRDAELTRRGLIVLRFTWTAVVRRREWWLQVVADVHARGPRS